MPGWIARKGDPFVTRSLSLVLELHVILRHYVRQHRLSLVCREKTPRAARHCSAPRLLLAPSRAVNEGDAPRVFPMSKSDVRRGRADVVPPATLAVGGHVREAQRIEGRCVREERLVVVRRRRSTRYQAAGRDGYAVGERDVLQRVPHERHYRRAGVNTLSEDGGEPWDSPQPTPFSLWDSFR